MAAEDSWAEYFASIEGVCPWSSSAYQKGQIKFVQGYRPIQDLAGYAAIVYFEDQLSSAELAYIIKQLNEDYDEYEFFYSHPEHGGNSAPEACIIQQDYQKIEAIRQKLPQNFEKA